MKSPIESVCVFLGSRSGTNPEFAATTRELTREFARRNLKLVYGGASVGLMGILADSALEAGVPVHGVIPDSLSDREIAHHGVTQLDIVGSMHERKERMMSQADAFILMPGGIGSLEEIFEVLTWRQLRIHDKPSAILNTAGYYDALLEFLQRAKRDDLLRTESIDSLIVESDPVILLDRLLSTGS